MASPTNEDTTPSIAIHEPTGDTPVSTDPFANQREAGEELSTSPPEGPSAADKRMSHEWDASKTKPSAFQKRKGSVHATPASRDGHVSGKERDQKYWDKLKEKGWLPGKKA